MWDDTLRLAVPLLAVLVPCIGVYWTFRREMLKHANPSVGQPGLVAIGGALASQEGARLYIEEIRALTSALIKLTEAQSRTATATEAHVECIKEIPEDVSRLRKKFAESLENDSRVLRQLTEVIETLVRIERAQVRN